ncbi:hypothetical protein MKK84_26235, partial [Methylobacterium sp. E-065]|uniref:hypothetical protein n=1 Tax=Methylobacterium sp. E-065 TaxID=2836583 RepID=UPI001FB9D471
ADDMERQLDRLEVRHGDILVLRTTQKLQSATAKKWQDDLIRMCAAAGSRCGRGWRRQLTGG